MFELADGRSVSDTDADWDDVVDEQRVRVGRELHVGDRFVYVFDLGDDWTHACEVEAGDVDPLEAYGATPRTPVPIFGWGSIPDQYGRRRADDSGDEDAEPARAAAISLTEWLNGGVGRPTRRR